MAKDKKPSIYSDRGNIGSADELDEYGVWVKSEPQVITTSAGAAGSPSVSSGQKAEDFDDSMFTTEGLSGGDSSGFEDIDFPGDSAGSEEPLGTDFEDFDVPGGTDEGIASSSADNDFDVPTVRSIENNLDNVQSDFDNVVRGSEGGNLSTQLLKKIASELSSIRGELHDLKKEFSTIRSGDKDGFFSEEDDETIALTGDEMNNILSTSDGEAPEAEQSGANKPEVKTMANILGEDEDETIALTGDEMDNILNSANFTEEAGTDETSNDSLGDYDDETISLTGDEMNNILNSADFTEETGTEESVDNSLSADLNDVSLDLPESTETDSSMSGLDEETPSAEDSTSADDINLDNALNEEDSLAMDDFDMSALDDTHLDESADSAGSDAIAEDEVTTEETTTEETTEEAAEDSSLAMDDFDMSAIDDAVASGSDIFENDIPDSSLSTEETSEETDIPNDDFDITALGGDPVTSDDTADVSAEAEADADADADDTAASVDSLGDIPTDNDDIVSLDDDGDLGSEISLDDFDMPSLSDDSTSDAPEVSDDAAASDVSVEEETTEESTVTDEGADKQEYIDIDIADLGVNLDSDSLETDSIADDNPDISGDAADSADTDITIDAAKDSKELEALRKNGATPVTFPPENSSYLEDEHIDLSEAAIDEPVLSTDDIDNPLSEPSFDMDSLDDFNITDEDTADVSVDEVPADEHSLDDGLSDDLNIDIDIPLDEPQDEGQDSPLADLADTAVSDDALSDSVLSDSVLSDSVLSSDDDLTIDEQLIPEGFEAEIQENHVPLDEGLDEDIIIDEAALTAPDLHEEEPVDLSEPSDSFPEEEPAEEPVAAPAPAAKAAPAPAKAPAPAPAAKAPAPAPAEIEDDMGIAEAPAAQAPSLPAGSTNQKVPGFQLPSDLKKELKNILSYMDQLLESLPEEKIEEFAKSEYFDSYKKLFKELGLV